MDLFWANLNWVLKSWTYRPSENNSRMFQLTAAIFVPASSKVLILLLWHFLMVRNILLTAKGWMLTLSAKASVLQSWKGWISGILQKPSSTSGNWRTLQHHGHERKAWRHETSHLGIVSSPNIRSANTVPAHLYKRVEEGITTTQTLHYDLALDKRRQLHHAYIPWMKNPEKSFLSIDVQEMLKDVATILKWVNNTVWGSTRKIEIFVEMQVMWQKKEPSGNVKTNFDTLYTWRTCTTEMFKWIMQTTMMFSKAPMKQLMNWWTPPWNSEYTIELLSGRHDSRSDDT